MKFRPIILYRPTLTKNSHTDTGTVVEETQEPQWHWQAKDLLVVLLAGITTLLDGESWVCDCVRY